MNPTVVVATIALGMLFATPAFATDETVLEQLKQMQEQINSLQKEVKGLKGDLANANARVEKAESRARMASVKQAEQTARTEAKKEAEVKVSLSPGPKFETADGEYSLKIGGFAQVDAGMFQDDVRDHPDGTNLRRARLNVSGNITKEWRYKLENDFANNASALTDAYLEYVGIEPVSIMVGQFKEPFSLETLTSDLFTTFIERAAPTAFSPDRKIGIAVSAPGDSALGAWTLAGGFFGAGTGTASTDDEAKDFTARATLAPIAEKDEVLHFGVAGSFRIPDSAGSHPMRFSSRAENSLTSALAVDTGNITNVNDVTLLGLEAAGVWGPASIQGEYIVADVERRGALSDPSYNGYYIEASYFLTGESRNYNVAQAKFDRVKPNNPFNFSKGGWGAWQAMARLSNLDLNDKGVNGGELNDWTLGLKWLPNANVMVSANYINVDTDSRAVTANDDPDVWILRTQFDF